MKADFRYTGITEEIFHSYGEKVARAQQKLEEGKEGFTGWLSLPVPDPDKQKEIKRLMEAAKTIRTSCDVLVVIGIGGSYLGAKACIEMMGHSFAPFQQKTEKDGPAVIFAGQNLSGTYHKELLEVLRDRELCLCVISKSGSTAETNIAFSVLKELMQQKYGRQAKERIFVVTDREKGLLREEADREGYESFVIPDDVGGRYSVLTPVGLLPIAAAGIDIKEILRGAADAKAEYDQAGIDQNPCLRYAVARNYLSSKGKSVEIYACYEPKLGSFGQWLMQLFGESEGKEGKGIFPSLLQFTTDLHSMGQFIQEGSQIFFETVLNVQHPEKDLDIPQTAAPAFRGKTMNRVNEAAVKGVAQAHAFGKVPVIIMDIQELTPYSFGRMVYFFERSCAIGGYMIQVNPFDQPGVEKYKAYMKEALNESV